MIGPGRGLSLQLTASFSTNWHEFERNYCSRPDKTFMRKDIQYSPYQVSFICVKENRRYSRRGRTAEEVDSEQHYGTVWKAIHEFSSVPILINAFYGNTSPELLELKSLFWGTVGACSSSQDEVGAQRAVESGANEKFSGSLTFTMIWIIVTRFVEDLRFCEEKKTLLHTTSVRFTLCDSG